MIRAPRLIRFVALAGLVLAAAPAALAQEVPEMRPEAIRADAANFRQCLANLWPQAQQMQISRPTFERELAPLEPNLRLVELMRAQPEFERPLWTYLAGAVSDARIRQGRELVARHAETFRMIEQRYGVDRHTLVALWAMETNYGSTMGELSVVRSTATLACVGRRKDFFAGELIAALALIERGLMPTQDLRGSWAGAFGHTQFMPSTFLRLAVDGDGDRRRNVVRSIPDAMASAANYLRNEGWRTGETWGYEVRLPANFDFRNSASDRRMSVAEWERLGIRRVNGQPFPRAGDIATLGLPAGARGPAFLLLPNFHALRKYNGSEAYAFALGHLADRMKGGGPFVQAWPTNLPPLSRNDRLDMQRLLAAMGFDVGTVDGKIGLKTRDAVRAFQLRVGMQADGYPTQDVLRRLRTGS
jgi:membrane-bound lytic murein transglycosylase B